MVRQFNDNWTYNLYSCNNLFTHYHFESKPLYIPPYPFSTARRPVDSIFCCTSADGRDVSTMTVSLSSEISTLWIPFTLLKLSLILFTHFWHVIWTVNSIWNKAHKHTYIHSYIHACTHDYKFWKLIVALAVLKDYIILYDYRNDDTEIKYVLFCSYNHETFCESGYLEDGLPFLLPFYY